MPKDDKQLQALTHFGFTEVPLAEKAEKVSAVFESVAPNYDLMNDAMSFGLHRWWKQFAVDQAKVKSGQQILDLASGTGDLAAKFAKRVGPTGKVIMSDINPAMLAEGREKLIDRGLFENLEFKIIDAEAIPYDANSFNLVTIAFGLRNVTDKNQALCEMYRVLKPGGKALILEFSRPGSETLGKIYDKYSFNVIPKMGRYLADDEESYQYLVESIRRHPDQDTLKAMMAAAGFKHCEYRNLTGGIVAVHWGYKFS